MNCEIDFENEFVERLIHLKEEKGVSSRDMSLSMGQSTSYINNIENRNCLPSLKTFFYICEYFDITPKEFFDYETEYPALKKQLFEEIKGLDHHEISHILAVIKDMNKIKSNMKRVKEYQFR